MPDEYDRMAWGLVREELRHLESNRKDQSIQLTIGEMLRPGTADKDPTAGFYRKGAMSPKMVQSIDAEIKRKIAEKLFPFRQANYQGKLSPEYNSCDFSTSWFWAASSKKVTEVSEDENSHVEKLIDLMQFSYFVGKKRLVGDLTSCNVMLSQHLLYRMIQRGLVDREPLKFMGDNFFEWMDVATFILFFYAKGHNIIGKRFMIPFQHGALLCEAGTSTLEVKYGYSPERIRYHDGIKSTRVVLPPMHKLFESPCGEFFYALKISTWIPWDYFSPEQCWVHDEMIKFKHKYQRLSQLTFWATMPDYEFKQGEPDVETELMAEFIADFLRIVSDHRWQWSFGAIAA